jgi:hypothetical protein
MKKEFEYNLEYFEKCLVNNVPYDIVPSLTWSDDEWFLDQENRNILKNEGFRTINNGESN